MPTFPMPEITASMADKIITGVLDNLCFWLSETRHARELGRDVSEREKHDEELLQKYEAWVNWSRSNWPTSRSNFMIDDEATRYGPCIPFNHGDRWEHDGTRWNIVRM